MKKLLLLALITANLSLFGQADPLSQFFNKLFIPDLVSYDSITVSLDSGAAFSAVGAAHQHYFVNGKIDTLAIFSGTSLAGIYKGKSKNNYRYTEISGYSTALMDSTDRVAFELDQNYRDSVISYYQYDNGSFAMFFQARPKFNTTGDPYQIDVFANFAGNLTKIGDYKIFYDQGRKDSVYYTVSPTGLGDGYIKLFYSQGNPSVIQKLETYEDVDNDGEKDLVQRLLCKTNQLNQVYEVTELIVDNNLNLTLNGAYRYGKRKNSTIGLPEGSNKQVKIFPNPTTDVLYLEGDWSDFASFEIFDISGKSVKTGKVTSRVDVTDLAKGSYQIIFDQKSTSAFVKK